MSAKNEVRVNRASRAELQYRAYELRLSGASLRSIALELGCSHPTVHRLLEKAIHERVDPNREAWVGLESDRLQCLFRAVWDRAVAGDLDAVKVAVRISESHRKLRGLDAPTVIEATTVELTTVEDRERELQAMIADARAKQALPVVDNP